MALYKVDQVFTYQDANDIKRLWASSTEPDLDTTTDGEIWLDTHTTPIKLKRRNSSKEENWDVIGELTAEEALNLLKTVDGSGSGLDADLLDGQEGSYYRNASNINNGTLDKSHLPPEAVRKDQNSDISSHTEWQDNYELRLGNDADFRARHTGTETTLYNYKGGLYLANIATGEMVIIAAHNSGGAWKSLLLANPDSGANGSVIIPLDNAYLKIGAGSDLQLFHNGSSSFIDNVTGHLYLRQLCNGNNIFMQGKNAAGTTKTLLTLDPDKAAIQSEGAMISQMYNEPIASNSILTTTITEGSPGWFIARDVGGEWTAYGITCLSSATDVSIKYQPTAPTFWSTTKDRTPSQLNVYFEGGFLNIQNKFATTRTVIFGFFGINLP